MVSSVSAHTVGVSMKTILEASTDVSQEEYQDQDRFKAKEVKDENVKNEVNRLENEQKKANQEQNAKKHEGMSSATAPQGNTMDGAFREAAGLHYQNFDQGHTRKTSVYQGYPLHPQQGRVYQPNFKQAPSVGSQSYRGQQPSVMDTTYQQLHGVQAGQYQDGGNRHQVGLDNGAGDSLDHLSTQLQSVLDFSRLPSLEEALSPSGIQHLNFNRQCLELYQGLLLCLPVRHLSPFSVGTLLSMRY